MEYSYRKSQSNYQLNAKDFYDYMAKVNATLEIMAEKFDGYEGTIASFLLEWQKNLDEFDESVILLLNQWLVDGTLETVLSDALLRTKSNIVLSRTEPSHINDQTYWFQIKSTENIIDLDDTISFEILP